MTCSGHRQSQLHHRQQRVAARKQARARAQRLEQRQRLVDARSPARNQTVPEPAGDPFLCPPELDPRPAPHSFALLWSPRQAEPKRSLRPTVHRDPRPAAVLRARRPPRVGQGGGGRARGHRARRVGRRRRAAQGARRRAVRARGPRDRADARRPAAGRAGRRDPRAGRAGAALGARIGGGRAADGGRRDEPRRRARRARWSRRSRRATTASRSRSRRSPGDAFGELLEHRRADIALGPHPGPEHSATIASAPFLRCRLIIVAAPGHPLAGRAAIAPAALARRALARRPARPRPDDQRRAVLRAQRARAGARRDVLEPGGRDRRRRGRRGDRARPRALGRRRGPPRGRSCASTCAGRRSSSCGTRARSASGRALPAALALQRFATTRRRRRRSPPAAPARSRRACARRCTSRCGGRSPTRSTRPRSAERLARRRRRRRARRPSGSSARSSRSPCSGRSGPRSRRGSPRRSGSGLRFSSARAVSIIPGVQKPHCSPCSSWKPCWTGSRTPSRSRPSTVVIS